MPTPAMKEVLAVRTSNFLPMNLFSPLRDDLEVIDCAGVSPRSTSSALVPLALILSLVSDIRAFVGFKPDWTLDLPKKSS